MSQTLALTTFNNITVKLTKKETQKDVYWLNIQHIVKEVSYFKMMTSIEDVPDAVRNMFTFAQFIQFLKKVIREEGSKLLKVDDCFNLIMKVPITILKQQKFIQAKITTVLDAETTFKSYMQRITFLNRQVQSLKSKTTQKNPQTLKPVQSSSKDKADPVQKPISPMKPIDRPDFTSKPPTDLQTRSMINEPIEKKKIKQAKHIGKKLNNAMELSEKPKALYTFGGNRENFVIQDKKIIINNEEYKIEANLVDRTQGKSITVNVTTIRGLYYFGELNDAEIMEFLSQPTGFSDSVALFGEIKHNCTKKAKQAIKVNEEQKKIQLMIRIKPTKMNIDKEDTIFAEIDIKVMKKEVVESQKQNSVNKEKLVNDVQAALTSKTPKKPAKKGQNLEMSLDMSTDRFDDVSNYSFKTHLPPSKGKNTKAKSKQKEADKDKSITGMSFDGMTKRGRKPKQATPPKAAQKAK